MRPPLFPAQQPVINWVKLPRQDRAALTLDLRCGKCYGTAHWLTSRKPDATLIIAPISTHDGWIESLQADGLQPIVLDGPKPKRVQTLLEHKRGIFLTNSEGLYTSELHKTRMRAIPTDLALYPWDAVVFDEFITLANPKNQIVDVAMNSALFKAPYKLMLSGEYTPEGAQQTFQPMCWLLGSFMGHTNFWRWRADNFYQTGFEWVAKDSHAIRRAFAEHAYILSRKDAGIEETKSFEKRYCVLPDAVRLDYDRIAKNLTVEIGDTIPCATCNAKGWIPVDGVEEMCGHCFGEGDLSARQTNLVMVTINWLAQLAGGYPKDFPHLLSEHKSKLLLEVIQERNNEALVVTFRYNAEILGCFDLLRRAGIKCEYMMGETVPTQRTALVRKLGSKNLKVLLVQSKVATYGLNLSVCDTMIRYSLPYSYNDVSQGMARIVHANKLERSLLYLDLLCRDTVDEAVHEVVTNKRATARLFMRQVKERVIAGVRVMV